MGLLQYDLRRVDRCYLEPNLPLFGGELYQRMKIFAPNRCATEIASVNLPGNLLLKANTSPFTRNSSCSIPPHEVPYAHRIPLLSLFALSSNSALRFAVQ